MACRLVSLLDFRPGIFQKLSVEDQLSLLLSLLSIQVALPLELVDASRRSTFKARFDHTASQHANGRIGSRNPAWLKIIGFSLAKSGRIADFTRGHARGHPVQGGLTCAHQRVTPGLRL
jgi:hypothetical protein